MQKCATANCLPAMRPILYYAPGSASFLVHWLLIELDLEYELCLVDFKSAAQKSPAYLALNPNGVVPTLEIDGAPHYEAAALIMHLADAHPAAGLAPAGPPVYARYDPPWTPWFLRRNEVLVPLADPAPGSGPR